MAPFAVLANMSVNGRLLGYTSWMQLRDLAPSAALTAVMSGIVLAARAALRPWLAGFSVPSVAYTTELAIVIPIGIAFYLASSLVIRPKPLLETCSLLLPIMQNVFRPLPGRFSGSSTGMTKTDDSLAAHFRETGNQLHGH